MRKNKGLTLIEVLIALAILSIALTAIIEATAQNIKHTLYLQQRVIATWIGTNTINYIRAGVLILPEAPDTFTKKTVTLGKHWSWNANLNVTPNKNIQQIKVVVYQEPNHIKLANLTSYLYAPKH
ncbi:MAG: hypothetical protein ACD_60C00128G0018 [uncultured bacterium]|nr:MAG: hypothetical protein ACD_60C00128G0018 [uncultured bacterium]